MKRRVKIAYAQDEPLDKISKQEIVTLNESHPELVGIAPTILSEIHGDLNIQNVLTRLDPDDDEDIALIDPRGVPLLGNDSNKVFERGDYCYDISKLPFSLGGFSEIRKQLIDYTVDGDSHSLKIQQHPGSDTMDGAAHLLIPKLAVNKVMKQIENVEHDGVRSFELRVKVGKSAHFVADCACALGRDTPWEIVPLFLLGLQKLNGIIDLLEGGALLGYQPAASNSTRLPAPSAWLQDEPQDNIAMFAADMGVSASAIPSDHPDASHFVLAPELGLGTAPYDLVLCDACTSCSTVHGLQAKLEMQSSHILATFALSEENLRLPMAF
ncbi:Uu.00g024460.m01.CDS01 [Anthostomella pinea]|uniref:Uu.00g024460.m01.CDS01 n=1 Tax=Anthostomella pinea TaxID=933095 RepID=A0AAI8YP20_9PEZI|nr:Uu.00g024460.m01.CDS01 [Anthostomella pinea]